MIEVAGGTASTGAVDKDVPLVLGTSFAASDTEGKGGGGGSGGDTDEFGAIVG